MLPENKQNRRYKQINCIGLQNNRRNTVTRSWIAATSAKHLPFMMLFRRGNRKKSTHRTPLIWRLQAIILEANKVNSFASSVLFVF
jgi:hypothetical protein